MSEIIIFNLIMIFFSIVGVGVFILLFFVSAPYGQHIRKGWGPNINNKLGWNGINNKMKKGFTS